MYVLNRNGEGMHKHGAGSLQCSAAGPLRWVAEQLAASLRRIEMKKTTVTTTKAQTDTHFPRLTNVPPAGKYTIEVTNTGTVDADDVVLGFIAIVPPTVINELTCPEGGLS